MYNSLIVSISVRIWKGILHGYEDSVIKKVVDSISKFISYLLKGSIIGNYFKSDKDFIKNTFFYKIYANFVDLINKIFKKINIYIKKIGQDSFFYQSIGQLFQGNEEALGTFFVFTFSLGVGIIVNNLLRGFYSGKSYLVGVLLMIISILGIMLKKDYKIIKDKSYIYNFLISIFLLDEDGGDKWW